MRLGERAYIELESQADDAKRRSQGDVTVPVSKARTRTPLVESATAVFDAITTEPPPVTMRALIEAEYRESYVEIWSQRPARKLVTTIEVLSSTNKRFGTIGWDQYVQKRQAHFMGRANLVELDLLRGGTRMPMDDDWPDSPYYALVSRKQAGQRCTVWPAHFARPLPVIPIPLAPPDADFPLALQPWSIRSTGGRVTRATSTIASRAAPDWHRPTPSGSTSGCVNARRKRNATTRDACQRSLLPALVLCAALGPAVCGARRGAIARQTICHGFPVEPCVKLH